MPRSLSSTASDLAQAVDGRSLFQLACACGLYTGRGHLLPPGAYDCACPRARAAPAAGAAQGPGGLSRSLGWVGASCHCSSLCAPGWWRLTADLDQSTTGEIANQAKISADALAALDTDLNGKLTSGLKGVADDATAALKDGDSPF